MNADNFGKNLLYFLSVLKLSQAELAFKTGLTTASISQIVNGQRRPGIRTICTILKVIPVTFETLVGPSPGEVVSGTLPNDDSKCQNPQASSEAKD